MPEILAKFYALSLHRRLLEEKIRYFAQEVRGLVLDIGSKNRRYDSYFTHADNIIAIDTSPLRNDVLKADVQMLPFEDVLFDTIVSFEVFEYVPDTRKAFGEIARVLKKNGIFMFSMPFLNPVHGDRVRYTEQGFAELLSDHFLIHEYCSLGGRNCLMWDIFFEKARNQYGNIAKSLLFPFLYFTKKLALLLDKREKNTRFAMGYFFICRKK